MSTLKILNWEVSDITKTKNKLNASKVEIDGIIFDSKFEGETYEALKSIEKSGLISELELQHEITLIPSFTYDRSTIRPTRMLVDFHFNLHLPDGRKIPVDFETKGYQTDVYRIKVKILKFLKKGLVKEGLYKYVLYRGKYLNSTYEQEMKIRDTLERVIKQFTK